MESQRRPYLTPHIRLTVYSFLSFTSILHQVGLLNQKERRYVASSEIARENKILRYKLKPIFWDSSNKHKLIPQFIASIVKEISFSILLSPSSNTRNQQLHKQLANLILSLPHYFDDAKISLEIVESTAACLLSYDKFCEILSRERPNLVFKAWGLYGTKNKQFKSQHLKHESGFSYLLQNSKSVHLYDIYFDLSGTFYYCGGEDPKQLSH